MMKRTQIIELLKNIKATFMSFFSIMMFVAMSIAIFCGISWTGPALQEAANEVFESGKLHDFEIIYPYGLTEENLNNLEQIEGIEVAEGGYSTFQIAKYNGNHTMKLMSLTEEVDVPVNVKGTLPKEKGELAVSSTWAKQENIKLGDQVKFKNDGKDEDGMKQLVEDTYTVTAIMDNPAYYSTRKWTYGIADIGKGTVDCLGWVAEDSFDESKYTGYPQIYIRSSILINEKILSKNYDNAAKSIYSILSKEGKKLSVKRYKEVKNAAQKKIDEGRAKLQTAWAKIQKAQTEIEDAERKIADAKEKIALAKEYLEELKAEAEGTGDWSDFAKAIELCIENYDLISKEIGNEYITPDREYIEELKAEAESTGDWSNFEKEIFSSVLNDLAKYEKQLKAKKVQVNKAIIKYENNVIKLEKKQKKVDEMEMYGMTILSRDANGGVQAIQRYSNVMGNFRYSMALLFVIIGLLVSYSAMSRIVKDQIISLGTKKALGLRRREITLSYLTYAGLAVFVGSVIGFIAGTFGIEQLIAARLGVRFVTGAYVSKFVWQQALLLYAVETGLILLTTWFACNSIMKMQAVELLKGPKPPEGKQRFFENWRIWDKLSLLNKTIVNNCLNDKKRVLGTIIGVAGCTALMVTSITASNNLQDSFTKHYEEIYHFDTIVKYKENRAGLQGKVENKLEKLGIKGTPVYTESFSIDLPDGKNSFVKVTVPFNDETFGDMYTAVPIKELANQKYDNGVWLNSAIEKHFDAKPGDPISIVDSSGQTRTFTIEGFFDYHLISYQMIMQESVYEKVMGKECKSNAFLADAGKMSVEKVRSEMNEIDGVISVKDDYQANENVFLEFSQASGIVIIIYQILSILMAIVVLLDLNIVCIEEKKRELIVLMINGFSMKDARRYVHRDTVVLTLIGIVLGVIFGTVMGNITILTIEPQEGSFVYGINWIACLIGAISSSVLSFIMGKIALRRISKFSLTDINKI